MDYYLIALIAFGILLIIWAFKDDFNESELETNKDKFSLLDKDNNDKDFNIVNNNIENEIDYITIKDNFYNIDNKQDKEIIINKEIKDKELKITQLQVEYNNMSISNKGYNIGDIHDKHFEASEEVKNHFKGMIKTSNNVNYNNIINNNNGGGNNGGGAIILPPKRPRPNCMS